MTLLHGITNIIHHSLDVEPSVCIQIMKPLVLQLSSFMDKKKKIKEKIETFKHI